MSKVKVSETVSHGTAMDLNTRILLGIVALVAVCTALIFVRNPLPPLFDWPNHMARHHLAARTLVGEALPAGYAIQYGLMPNLGADIVMPVLIRIFGDTLASQIFLAGSVLLMWLAAAALYVQYAGRTRSALVATLVLAPWLISATMFLGFMNSYSGCGVGILAAVHFISLARSKPTAPSYVLHAMFAALTYLWHLSSFGTYGVLIASYLLQQLLDAPRQDRKQVLLRLAPLAATTLPAIALALWVAGTPGANALTGALVWRGVVTKALNIAELFMAYQNTVDAILLLAWLASIALIFALPSIRRPRLDYMAIATLAFLALVFVLPSDIGVIYFVDKRPTLPLLICSVGLLANLRLSRLFHYGLAGIAAVTLVRLANIDRNWLERSRGTAALINYFATAEQRPRILVANTHYGWRRSYETQVAGWLVARTGAYVSNLWAIPGQQPLRHTMPSYGLVPTHFLSDPKVLCTHAATIATHFDYAWVNDPTVMVQIPAGWQQILKTSESTLWKVQPSSGACKGP